MKNQTNHEKWEREFKEWANKAFPQSHPQINAMQLGWVAAKAHEAKKSTWISVDDRLPEKSGQYLVFKSEPTFENQVLEEIGISEFFFRFKNIPQVALCNPLAAPSTTTTREINYDD